MFKLLHAGSLTTALLLLSCNRSAPQIPDQPPQNGQASVEPQQTNHQEDIDLSGLVGKPMGEVIARLHVQLDKSPVIQEPPLVFRGVTGKTPAGEEVWVYVPRQEALTGLVEAMEGRRKEARLNWPTVEDLKPMPVIGIAIKRGSKWQTTGEVIGYYHWNLPRNVEQDS